MIEIYWFKTNLMVASNWCGLKPFEPKFRKWRRHISAGRWTEIYFYLHHFKKGQHISVALLWLTVSSYREWNWIKFQVHVRFFVITMFWIPRITKIFLRFHCWTKIKKNRCFWKSNDSRSHENNSVLFTTTLKAFMLMRSRRISHQLICIDPRVGCVQHIAWAAVLFV